MQSHLYPEKTAIIPFIEDSEIWGFDRGRVLASKCSLTPIAPSPTFPDYRVKENFPPACLPLRVCMPPRGKETFRFTAMQDGGAHAPNSCRTCRQRRVKCDRLLPTCQRCADLKLRCLGYERRKRLVWTNSMASRGKMMGKATFDTADEFSKRSDSEVRLLFPEPRSGEHGEREARPSPVSVSWSLVEPGLQDLSQDCRQYIRYCEFPPLPLSLAELTSQSISSCQKNASCTTIRQRTPSSH